jgi:hypothetical protein
MIQVLIKLNACRPAAMLASVWGRDTYCGSAGDKYVFRVNCVIAEKTEHTACIIQHIFQQIA